MTFPKSFTASIIGKIWMCYRVKSIIAVHQAAAVQKNESEPQNLHLKKPQKNDELLIINKLFILQL